MSTQLCWTGSKMAEVASHMMDRIPQASLRANRSFPTFHNLDTHLFQSILRLTGRESTNRRDCLVSILLCQRSSLLQPITLSDYLTCLQMLSVLSPRRTWKYSPSPHRPRRQTSFQQVCPTRASPSTRTIMAPLLALTPNLPPPAYPALPR